MSQAPNPSLAAADAVSGIDLQIKSQEQISGEQRQALETACIDLTCKLENTLANAREMPQAEFIDESGEIGRSMLDALATFTKSFLSGEAAEQAVKEIGAAVTSSYSFDEVRKTRPFTNALARTFWNTEETKEIQVAHRLLGESLIRACAATMYHTIVLMGADTDAGQEIDQSTIVFVTELQEFWN